MKRLKILVSAYACNPMSSVQLHPGEDITGWRLVGQISRFHDVWVITHHYNRRGVDEARAAGSYPDVRFHFLDLPKILRVLYKIAFGQRIYYYLWQIAAWRLARRLHRIVGFDLAHHLTFGNDWIPSYIGAFLPVPFVHGPVGGGQRTPAPLLREYTLAGRLAEKGREAAQWVGRHDPVRRRALRRASAILVCNEETRGKIPARDRSKVDFFPVNGMSREDLDLLKRTPAPHSLFRVLSAGRLHRLKGFALAVRAFARFVRTHPEAEMVIVGMGEEEPSIRAAIAEQGVGDKVRLVPWMPRARLLESMAASDVFLFPSFRDGGGAVVVEAMAASVPPIVLDSGGPGLHVEKEWGFKAAPARADAVAAEMAAALERLVENPELRAEMGRAGRRRVEEYYLYDREGERLLEIYRAALGGQILA